MTARPHDRTTALAALVAMLLCSTSIAACKSEADKCRERNHEIYGKKAAECKDAACKAEVAKDLKAYLETCDSMK